MPTSGRWLRRVSLLLAATVLLGGTGAADAAQAKKYNVLFLFADDMRADTIAALGNKHIRTPNLDGLVRGGTAFRNAHVLGSMSGAVCMPSRAMLMSGRTLFRVPMDLRGTETMGEVFRRSKYQTFGIGKWHNGQESFARCFGESSAVFFGGMSDHYNVPVQRLRNGKYEKYDAKGTHSSELFANAAVDFLKGRAKAADGGAPFFLYVAFTAPHDPRDAPQKYRDIYYKDRPPLPNNFLPQHPFDNGDLVLRDEYLAPWPRTKEVISDQLAEYYALITHLDEQIGRVLEALRQTGQVDDTIIVFAADNGLALGSHGLLGKQSLYQHSSRVPLIFAGPGIPANERRDALAYLLDVYPTLCELNGISVPDGVEGQSLRGVIGGQQAKVRDTLYTNYRKLQRGVRDERWSLVCYPQVNHVQLFDLQEDPDQLTDLADRPEQAERVARMKGQILEWEKAIGMEAAPLIVANPRSLVVDLTGHARQPDQWQPEWIRKKYFGR